MVRGAGGEPVLGQRVGRGAEREDGVVAAEVGPGVSAEAAELDAVASGADAAMDDHAGFGVVDGDEGGGRFAALGGEEMPRAAEVAVALLADRGEEEQRTLSLDRARLQGAGDGQDAGEPGGGVGDAGCVVLVGGDGLAVAVGIGLLGTCDGDWLVGGEDGVEVG